MGVVKNPVLLDKLNSKWKEVFPITLEYVNEPAEIQSEISKRVREFYFSNNPITADNPKNLSNVNFISTIQLSFNLTNLSIRCFIQILRHIRIKHSSTELLKPLDFMQSLANEKLILYTSSILDMKELTALSH